jgi:hypothetical protein
MATNTIAGVNLAQIAEETLPSLQSLFAPLAGVITDFSNDISNEGASVTTRFATKPTAVDLASGYTSQNTTLTAKTVTLDTFYGFVYGFKDVERSKSSLMLNDLFIQPSLQALGDKVFGDLWNLVVNANFGTSTTITAANFDRDDIVDIGTTLTNTKKAPKSGRTIWAAPGHYASIIKTLNSAEFPGMDMNKTEGIAPRVAGFNLYESDQCDANAENLAAFAFHRTALLMAARGVDATGAAEVGVEVENITIPGLNLPVQFRRWYDANAGELKYSIGLLYGVAFGMDFGVRVVTA